MQLFGLDPDEPNYRVTGLTCDKGYTSVPDTENERFTVII